MKVKRLASFVSAFMGSTSILIIASVGYANGSTPKQDSVNLPVDHSSSSLSIITAWEWPWESTKYPFRFAIKHDFGFVYRTLYGKDRNDAAGKTLAENYFMHSGACQCEGTSATAAPPSCQEPEIP